jgi:gliding motility-associated-like protein
MTFFKNAVCVLATLVPAAVFSQYIQVNDTYSAQQLVEDVLVDSGCANVSNFSVSGDTFSAGQQSYGYFSAGTSGFPFSEGIVLSTSRAVRTQGPNSDLIDEGSTAWAGDSDLEQALNINNTFNATILEFDFTPLTSEISFDYIFASEEYQGTAPCHYSDGFAFLLKPVGSTGPYQNLAVIPNTTTPVLVTSVHPDIPGGNGCPAQNEAYFGGFNPSAHPINFNGQTVVMTASASVVPGTTYHIKLVIADHENIRYDSAIFLGGGSFKVGTDIGPDRLEATNNPLCEGENLMLDATETGASAYQWFKDGVALPGETNPTYEVTNTMSGGYSVIITLGAAACTVEGEVAIEYVSRPVLNDPTNIVECDYDGDGVAIFDLTNIENILTTGNSGLGSVTYYNSLSDAENELNPVQNPTAYQSGVGYLVARAENTYGCAGFATVILQLANNPVTVPPPFESCDTIGAEDGLTGFNLSTDITPMLTAGLPSGIVAEYYATLADAAAHTNPLSDPFTNTQPGQQIIYARLVNGPDCYGIIPVTLIVHTFDPVGFADETVYSCELDPATLSVATTFSSYLWSNGETDASIDALPGNYTVTVTDTNGCSATKNFTVVASGIATNIFAEVRDFSGNQNSVLVHFTGNGDYEFSLDGITFQASPLFTDVAVGEYYVYIRDTHGCGTSPPFAIALMDFPHYFTPNGDGIHDVWEIQYLERQPRATVSIFDRFGKLVYRFSGNGTGWNGKLNGADLPSTDYWFTLNLENGRIVKSHFSLKR